MNVFIENTINGLGTCHLELHVTSDATVDSLISAFCVDKGVRHRPQYVLKTAQNVILDSTKDVAGCGIASGDVLYLTTKNEEQQLFGFHNWWLMAGVACFIGLVGLIAISILFSMNGGTPISYGIVFDAGSTHTSMAIYKWDGEKIYGTGQVKQIEFCNANGSGISDYVNNTQKISKMLQNCLADAKGRIPRDQDDSSELFFGATAGMRILSLTDPEGATAVMAAVNEALSNSGFAFHPDHARILTGEEEGVFGWISVNYLSQVLGAVPRLDTFGALDMGGASTQISYSTNHSGEIDLRLYGYDYHIFSRSFLCFGLTEFERRFYAQLAMDADNETTISNPCNPIGEMHSVSHDYLFNHVCTVNETKSVKNYTVLGSYNQEQCDRALANLLDYDNCTQKYKYCLNANNVAETNDKFMAFSAYYSVLNDLNVTDSTLDQVRETIYTYCNKTKHQEIQLQLSNSMPAYLTQVCLRSQYILKLLTDVYGFEKKWDNLAFVNTINGADVGWALGFMTNATNAIPQEDPYVMLNLTAFVMLTLLFVTFMLIGVAFMCQAWKQKHRSSVYQRFSQYGAI